MFFDNSKSNSTQIEYFVKMLYFGMFSPSFYCKRQVLIQIVVHNQSCISTSDSISAVSANSERMAFHRKQNRNRCA